MFKVKDIVIHPGHGVCKITAIAKDILPNIKGPVYVLKPITPTTGQFRLLIAEDKIEVSGLRYPIRKNEVPRLFRILEDSPNDILEDRKKGYPITKEKIYSGDIYKIAEAIRDLENQNNYGTSRLRDDLLQFARKILTEEISHVQGISKDKVNKLIEDALKRKKE